MTLALHSPAFEPGSPIPARFDHERGDLSPALIWDGVPEGAAGSQRLRPAGLPGTSPAARR